MVKAQAACRGRLVGLYKISSHKNNCRLRRSGSRGLIDRDVPVRTPVKDGGDDNRLACPAVRPRRGGEIRYPWPLGWKYRAGQALKPETSRPDKHVVAWVDIAGDRGSTPLASRLRPQRNAVQDEARPGTAIGEGGRINLIHRRGIIRQGLWRDEARAHGVAHQARHIVDSQPVHQLQAMRIHRLHAQL
jgi:hypothetical protein